MDFRYVVITPARNEGQYLPETIRSMTAQTVRPMQWILVNDGSTDITGELIDAAAEEYSWITGLHLTADGESQQRGDRAIEAKEIVAFHRGLAHIRFPECWEYIVKLDADVGFESGYFEECLREFEKDDLLGVAGGTIVTQVAGGFEVEKHPAFHVRGATKIYRRSCWEAMGGISTRPGWDTLDEVKANQLGWKTRTLSGTEILHFRPTGAGNGSWKNGLKNGMWSYEIGYHPLFLLLRAGRQLFHPPYLTGSVALVTGYIRAAWQGLARPDEDLARYVWQQQWNRMTGKSTIWR